MSGRRSTPGAFPAKRTLGEELDVYATIFADGHDILRAALRHRAPGTREWAEAPMEPLGNDRWGGAFEPDRLGRWQYSVVAWIDRLASWRHEIERKVEGGQTDLTGELAEGAALLGVKTLSLADALDTSRTPALPREAETASDPLELIVDRDRATFGAWYELFPRSFGGFAGVERALPELAALGFDVLYFPPIHPIGVTHRKGKNNALTAGPGRPGQPLGDRLRRREATPRSHRSSARSPTSRAWSQPPPEHGLEIALDLALQCSPDHPWLTEHPDWFQRRPDGTLKYAENPPKRYQDIYNLNFQSDDWRALWKALLDVVLTWAERGVRIFRVDNPHTKPVAFWSWLIREAQAVHPDLVFLSEAFTRPAMMATLAKAGFSQSYTYFTWRNTRTELTEYVWQLTIGDLPQFFRPNFFTNTPDILTEYLQHGGRPAFEARLVLAATLSPSYGIYSGFENLEGTPREPGSEEYLDSEKYELKARALDGELLPLVARLNEIRRATPALQRLAQRHVPRDRERAADRLREGQWSNTVVVCVNLDPKSAQVGLVTIPPSLGLPATFTVTDLVVGGSWTWRTGGNYVQACTGNAAGPHTRRRRMRCE